ncbi:unnamed protein product, partial [Didymodactylos carnosus]
RLLSTASLSVYLQVDGTYKLNWNNFPVLVCGTSDAQRHFHPFGIALVYSDESTACYVDLFKALKWSIPLVTNQAYYIHFLIADGSKAITKAQQQEFSCIRNLNGKIKKHYTLRSKLPLSGFLSIGCQTISDWALKLHNCVFSLEPIVSKDLELFVSKWSTSISKSMIPLPWNVYEQVVPTIHVQLDVQQWIDMYQHCQFNTFDNYCRWYESAHIVSVQQMYCTCRYFCKEYICKHVVGLKIVYGIHKLPNDRLPPGKKPRERPKKQVLLYYFGEHKLLFFVYKLETRKAPLLIRFGT